MGRVRRSYYALINKMVLYRKARWCFTLAIVLVYAQTVQRMSFDVATYLIGFYLLQLLVGYFTPRGITEEINEQHAEGSLYSMSDGLEEEEAELVEQENLAEEGGDKPLLRSLG
jgi:Rer1 family